MRAWRRGLGALGLGAISLLPAGCGKDDGPTALQISQLIGDWLGTTSQSEVFGFTVSSSGITEFMISYNLSGSSCSYSATVTMGGSTDAVQNNGFTAVYNLTASLGASFTFEGDFTSASAANGTFSISDSDCVGTASGTWSASKQ